MRTALCFFMLLCAVLSCSGQLTREQRLQDSIIGWDPKNIYDHLKPQTNAITRQREVQLNKMVEWMKKSYTPVGGLGEYQRFINPTGCQALFSVWDVDPGHLDAQKHFRPIGATGFPRFYMAANFLSGAWNIDFMCTDNEWYFTMQPDGYSPNSTEEKRRAGSDPRISPLVHPWLTWINEWYTVYLTPGNRLPMTRVTKGEFLRAALQHLDDVRDRQAKENVRALLEKYRNALNEPASVSSWQFRTNDIYTGSFDVFYHGVNWTYFPVYRIDAATIAKMKQAQPLWISITFPFETPTSGNKAYEMYNSVTKHLNYEYIYNYFFDTAKVRGVSYAPVDEEGLKARLDGFRKKNTANIEAKADTRGWAANVHFQDDLASAAEGSEPPDWSFSRHDELDKIVSLAGRAGKWLQLGYNNPSMPALLKKPLPKNFSIEFDLVTAEFAGTYGGGVRLYLSTNKAAPNGNEQITSHSATIAIDIIAGNEKDYNNNNYSGTARVQLLRVPEVNEEHFVKGAKYTYALREFTDKKRMIHVALEVDNGKLRLLINGEEAMASKDMLLTYGGKCADCTVPADLDFNYIQWKRTQSAVPSFIGNIKVLKK